MPLTQPDKKTENNQIDCTEESGGTVNNDSLLVIKNTSRESPGETDHTSVLKSEDSILENCEEKGVIEVQEVPQLKLGDPLKLDVSPFDVMEVALDSSQWEHLSSEARHQLSLIPPGYQPVLHQVGGHRHVDGKQGECVY